MTLRDRLDGDWRHLNELSGRQAVARGWFSMMGPRTFPVLLLRWATALHEKGFRRFAKIIGGLNLLLFGLEAPASLNIGPGLVLPHPNGTILGARSIGENVMIYQQVTLGAKTADFRYDPALRPVVGNNVTISAGAKILGGIVLGDHCVIGANAVVLVDVPAGFTAVGVPARLIAPGLAKPADQPST